MNRNLSNSLKVAFAIVLFAFSGFGQARADDIIDVDTTLVLFGAIDPALFDQPPEENGGPYTGAELAGFRVELEQACREAEAIWQERIVGYSTELPNAIRTQLTTLKIKCEIGEIDCIPEPPEPNILAVAIQEAVVTIGRTEGISQVVTHSVSIESTIRFDYCDLRSMSNGGFFTRLAAHEMGHALGFNSLLLPVNDLIGPASAVGIEGYVGGKYALPAFRRETGNPFATFIPVQQAVVGGGLESVSVAAGGHWIGSFQVFDPTTSETRTDLMVPFLGSDPRVFISETTFAAMADLGYAVTGVNDRFVAPGSGLGRWPKIAGAGLGPFGGTGIRFDTDDTDGVRVQRVTGQMNAVFAANESAGSGNVTVASPTRTDPFNLRHHRWVKQNK